MEFAASLIAIVGLADNIISRCRRYISGVKDCPTDLRTILVETSSLKSVIENLEFLYGNSPDPDLKKFFLALDAENGPVRGCRDCLEKLGALLAEGTVKAEHGTKRRAVLPTMQELAWPFRESKARRLLENLSRFRSAISLALVTDSSYVTKFKVSHPTWPD